MRKSTVKKTVTKAPVNKKETIKAETVLTLQRPLRLWRRLLSIAVSAQTLRFRSFRLLYR